MIKRVSAAGLMHNAGLTGPFYSVKYIVYLNIFLQIILFHENSKKWNLPWKSYLWDLQTA